jgi:hypothetical protein
VVDSLEDLDIKLLGFRGIERHTEGHECVCEPLDADANGTITEVGFASLGNGAVVGIDDAVGIVCDSLGNGVKLLEVVLAIGDICGQCEGGKVAYGGLIGGVFDNFGAKVRRLDGAEVLLVRFGCRNSISTAI